MLVSSSWSKWDDRRERWESKQSKKTIEDEDMCRTIEDEDMCREREYFGERESTKNFRWKDGINLTLYTILKIKCSEKECNCLKH